MEVDINEPISKFFNVFLRMFQLGAQVALAYWAVRFHQYSTDQCGHLYLNIASYIAYALVLINLISLIYLRTSQKFPRCFSFVIYFIDLLCAGALIAQYFLLKTGSKLQCAADKVFSEFSALQAALCVIVTFAILLGKLGWAQRYTNSPGNLVWVPLMLGYMWEDKFSLIMMIIGIVAGVISLLTFFVNLVTCSGPTTKTKKLLVGVWILCLILMIGCEIYAVITYLTVGEVTEFKDVQAKKTLAVFIVVNLLDLLFWIWGFSTLNYENGDPVRGQLFEPEELEQNHQNNYDNYDHNQPQRNTYNRNSNINEARRTTQLTNPNNNRTSVNNNEIGTLQY